MAASAGCRLPARWRTSAARAASGRRPRAGRRPRRRPQPRTTRRARARRCRAARARGRSRAGPPRRARPRPGRGGRRSPRARRGRRRRGRPRARRRPRGARAARTQPLRSPGQIERALVELRCVAVGVHALRGGRGFGQRDARTLDVARAEPVRGPLGRRCAPVLERAGGGRVQSPAARPRDRLLHGLAHERVAEGEQPGRLRSGIRPRGPPRERRRAALPNTCSTSLAPATAARSRALRASSESASVRSSTASSTVSGSGRRSAASVLRPPSESVAASCST